MLSRKAEALWKKVALAGVARIRATEAGVAELDPAQDVDSYIINWASFIHH